jgi:hypothetical protein
LCLRLQLPEVPNSENNKTCCATNCVYIVWISTSKFTMYVCML